MSSDEKLRSLVATGIYHTKTRNAVTALSRAQITVASFLGVAIGILLPGIFPHDEVGFLLFALVVIVAFAVITFQVPRLAREVAAVTIALDTIKGDHLRHILTNEEFRALADHQRESERTLLEKFPRARGIVEGRGWFGAYYTRTLRTRMRALAKLHPGADVAAALQDTIWEGLSLETSNADPEVSAH